MVEFWGRVELCCAGSTTAVEEHTSLTDRSKISNRFKLYLSTLWVYSVRDEWGYVLAMASPTHFGSHGDQ